MKLIVDVSKEDYEVIINHCDDYVKSLYNEPEERCILAVKNGTPLPKGHGRLIDANDLKWQFDKRDELNGFTENIIAGTPTIIEADNERSE